MCETLCTKCKRCNKKIYKGNSIALFFRNGKCFIRKHRSSTTSKGRGGWYCDECSELLLKNE